MYNESLKRRFIDESFKDGGDIKRAESLFKAIEPYEVECGADFCTWTAEELAPIIEKLVGIRRRSKWAVLWELKRYTSWCISNGVQDACDGIFHVEVTGYEKIRKQMVSSPLQMHKFLCDVFSDDPNPTIDDVYKGFFWLAFLGLNLEDALLVKTSDVDISSRTIKYSNGKRIADIYPYAIRTFENLLSPVMIYRKDDYEEASRIRERAPGDLLLRGFRQPTWSRVRIQNALSDKVNEAYKLGKTDKKLSYERARLCGIFCRAYEFEEAYKYVDFKEVAIYDVESKQYSVELPLKKRVTTASNDYLVDYNRWKAAFNKWV